MSAAGVKGSTAHENHLQEELSHIQQVDRTVKQPLFTSHKRKGWGAVGGSGGGGIGGEEEELEGEEEEEEEGRRKKDSINCLFCLLAKKKQLRTRSRSFRFLPRRIPPGPGRL